MKKNPGRKERREKERKERRDAKYNASLGKSHRERLARQGVQKGR